MNKTLDQVYRDPLIVVQPEHEKEYYSAKLIYVDGKENIKYYYFNVYRGWNNLINKLFLETCKHGKYLVELVICKYELPEKK